MFVFLGAVAGLLGFLPLCLALRLSKNVTKTSSLGYGSLLILGVFLSLIILFASVLLCYFFAKDNIVAFTLAAAITIALFAIVYGIYTTLRRNKTAKERSKNKE